MSVKPHTQQPPPPPPLHSNFVNARRGSGPTGNKKKKNRNRNKGRKSNLHTPLQATSPTQVPVTFTPTGLQVSGLNTDVTKNPAPAGQLSSHFHPDLRAQQNLPLVPNLSVEQKQAFWAWYQLLASRAGTSLPSHQQPASNYSALPALPSIPGMSLPPSPVNYLGNSIQTPLKTTVNLGSPMTGTSIHSSPVSTVPPPGQNTHYSYVTSLPPPPMNMHPEWVNAYSNEFQAVSQHRRADLSSNAGREVGNEPTNAQDLAICIGSQTF